MLNISEFVKIVAVLLMSTENMVIIVISAGGFNLIFGP